MSSRPHCNTPWFRDCLLLLGMCFGAPAAADVLKREKDLQPFADTVMKAVAQGDLNAAYAAIAQVSVLPATEIEQGRQASLAQRNEAFIVRYGKTRVTSSWPGSNSATRWCAWCIWNGPSVIR